MVNIGWKNRKHSLFPEITPTGSMGVTNVRGLEQYKMHCIKSRK